MSKIFTYHTLPPKTKKAIVKIGELYKTDYGKWKNYYKKINDIHYVALVDRNYYDNRDIEITYWAQCISTYELMTEEIILELFPYIYGIEKGEIDKDE